MTLDGYAPGTYEYTCNFGSGGDETFRIHVTADPETFNNGKTCYDTISGDTVWVTIRAVRSNTIKVPVSPPASISIGWGSNPAPFGNWMDITFTNFPTGTLTWYCVEEGHSYGPYHTSLSSGTETLTSNTCDDTQGGGSDYVTADGVDSNTIPTD